MTEFAAWVSTTARSLGYKTDAALASAINVQQSTVTRWRQGNQPQIKHLVALARLFKMGIEPLLTLSGHVPSDVLSDGKPPEQPITESVRRIRDAPLSDMQKKALQEYWNRRLDEERQLLGDLIDGALKSEDWSRQEGGHWVSHLVARSAISTRSHDTAILVEQLFAVEAAPRKRRRRGSLQEDDNPTE